MLNIPNIILQIRFNIIWTGFFDRNTKIAKTIEKNENIKNKKDLRTRMTYNSENTS